APLLYDFYHACYLLDGIFVDTRRLGIYDGRPYHAAMQHSGNANVLRIGEFAVELWGQIPPVGAFADNPVAFRIFDAHVRGNLQFPARPADTQSGVEALVTDERPISNLLHWIAGDAHYAP